MHKQYAVEQIERFKRAPKRWAAWASEYENSTRFMIIHLIRSFNLRHTRDVVMLHAIYSRYGLPDFDFSAQAQRANDYFQRYHRNNIDLCHVTIAQAKVLAGIADEAGLDGFVECLDGELDTPWRWDRGEGLSGEGELVLVDRDVLCAVPTIGGILSDAGVDMLSKRFPNDVLLPVSRALAEAHFNHHPQRWMVVNWRGHGVAVTPDEARLLGLTEAPNWVPDLGEVPAVPTRSDFAKIDL